MLSAVAGLCPFYCPLQHPSQISSKGSILWTSAGTQYSDLDSVVCLVMMPPQVGCRKCLLPEDCPSQPLHTSLKRCSEAQSLFHIPGVEMAKCHNKERLLSAEQCVEQQLCSGQGRFLPQLLRPEHLLIHHPDSKGSPSSRRIARVAGKPECSCSELLYAHIAPLTRRNLGSRCCPESVAYRLPPAFQSLLYINASSFKLSRRPLAA